MKRKLRLLLAMVLAMTMVMGISVTAFAAPAGTSWDEQNECPTHHGSAGDGVQHTYSFGRAFDHGIDGLCVDCIVYDLEECRPVRLDESIADEWNAPVSFFANGEYSEGWYYASESTGWLCYPCGGSAAEAFDSVDIDLSCVRAGKTPAQIFANGAIGITTDLDDTISIGTDSCITDIEYTQLADDSVLEEGKEYFIFLYLTSTSREFKADGPEGTPVSSVALRNLDRIEEVMGVNDDDTIAEQGKHLYVAIRFKFDSSTPDPKPTPEKASAPAHVHNFKWQTITAPTKETDGLEGEVCSCGATRNTQKLSAYGYALNQYATPMINAAKSGQTITFEFGEWNSFPKSFMAKLVDKSAQNVTFVFHYKWNHVKQEITIPAGTPIDLNFDWYGPAKMAELYGAY